jgi:glutathione synthase/RimK-type ligase-like ATP-grasp enzyme
MLAKRSISVPETFKLVKNFLQRLSLDMDTLQSHQFVIKPNQGSKGNGIFLVK